MGIRGDQREIELNVGWGRLAAVECGRGGAHRVLAVHGWLDNAASFGPLAEHLDDVHLVALDLPGHGRSAHRPFGATYHLVDYVADVAAAVRALDWEQCNLLGHSLGAGVVSLFAAALPERALSLAMIDGVGPVSGRAGEATARLRRAVAHRIRPDRDAAPGYVSVDDAVAARLRATTMCESSARRIVERNLAPAEDGGWRWRTDRRVTHASPVYLGEDTVREFLAAIRCRTLLVVAANGIIAPRETTWVRAACIGDLETVELPGNHHLHMDDPEPLAARYREFLEADSQ